MFEKEWFEGQVGTLKGGGRRKVEGEEGISRECEYVSPTDGALVVMLFVKVEARVEFCSFPFFGYVELEGEVSGRGGGGGYTLLCEAIRFCREKMRWYWNAAEAGSWERGELR